VNPPNNFRSLKNSDIKRGS